MTGRDGSDPRDESSVPSTDEPRNAPPEALARRVFEANPVSTVVVDSAGAFVYANDRAAETLGLTAAEFIDRSYDHPEWVLYYDDGTPVPVSENPVVAVVATVTDREPTAMPALYAIVDPEALAALVASARETHTRIACPYEGCRVTASSDGRVVVEPPRN